MQKNKNKIKIRQKLLIGFSAVLFFSYLLTGVIFNIAIRLVTVDRGLNFYNPPYPTETSVFIVNTGTISIFSVSVMFVMAVIVTYFLSNSITRPIEKLGKFALNIGNGDFTPNDFEFKEKELEDLNMALNKSVKQLAAYDSEQKTFFQNASHELRTPLMSIKCYAEGISFDLMEPKKASETILQETDKLSDLVTDLLYIAKIDNISTAYIAEEVDLLELLRNAAIRQEVVAAKGNINFSVNFDEVSIYYNCVSELISRAIDNLISNAIRYANSEIILSCYRRENHIEICVVDDGKGIEPDLLPHVFERFYKGVDGIHGIGLSIVKSIIEQQGGRISARNGDKGAVFTMTLPM
ncbi:MAG: HAMP domain-containing histidine kinase [Defluviitaleaceae bacterium]|nr:HAMP domain-containing histidine kinase [Defluviitaleaceae bacterium]